MTGRKTLDQMTSDDLDQLHAQLAEARQRAADAYGQRDRLRLRIAALAERWRLPGHISMPDAAAEIVEALDREKWAPCPDPIARIRALAEEHPVAIDTALIHEALAAPAATQATEVVVSVHGARDLSPAAEEALGALIDVAKKQITEEQP